MKVEVFNVKVEQGDREIQLHSTYYLPLSSQIG